MFKRLIGCITAAILLTTPYTYADMAGFEGGVQGDPTLKSDTYNYEEFCFLTGKPILLTGTLSVPDAPVGKEVYTLAYKYDLVNVEEDVTVTRKITVEVTDKKNDAFKQTQRKSKITQFSESVTAGDNKYTLNSYIYTKSALVDNTPAVDYSSGTFYGKRTYYINGTPTKNDGKIVIETNGDPVIGYSHYWGDSLTTVVEHRITGEILDPEYDDTDSASDKYLEWEGTVSLRLSRTDKRSFSKVVNSPQTFSFRSGFVKNRSLENILQYEYDLPRLDDEGLPTSRRSVATQNLRRDALLDNDSLLSPKYRDIGGHWAEEPIFLLASLNIFSNDSSYFSPDTPITRFDFARAIANSLSEVKELTAAERIRLKRDPKAVKLFDDITVDDPEYAYVRFVKDRGIMVGENSYFLPDRTLRRSEAIQIMVNALGITHLAPSPPYQLGYRDESEIPDWSKDAIYMARDISLVTGYEDGTIRPGEMVTRAEAAALISKFIQHIREDINYDYRERIINKY